MRSYESFAGRFTVLCLSNTGLHLLGFLYRIFLSRLAGAEGLGVYRLAFSAYIVIHAASLSGVTMACTRMAASWNAQGRAGAIRHLVARAFRTFVLFFFCGASVLLLFRNWIGTQVLGDARTIACMPVLLLCIALTGIENIFKSTMIGLDRVDNAAASELCEQIVRIVCTLVLLQWGGTNDLARVAVLIFTGMTLSECVSAFLMTRMYFSLSLPPAAPMPPDSAREFRRIVLPVSASALCGNLISSAGAVLLPLRLCASGLTRTHAVELLGVVSGVAAPIILLPMALVSSLCTVTMPEVSRHAAAHGSPALRQFCGQAIFGAGAIGLPATALLIPLAPTIARLFFYRAVPPSYFWLLGLSAALCYYQMITASILNGLGQQQFAVTTAISGEVLQLGLVWLWVAQPALRVHGYILAQCIAPLLVALCNLIRLVSCGALTFSPMQQFGVPLVCSAVILLWTRVFYSVFLGLCGSQWSGLFLTICSAALLYVLLLRLFGIRLLRYLSVRPENTAHLALFY